MCCRFYEKYISLSVLNCETRAKRIFVRKNRHYYINFCFVQMFSHHFRFNSTTISKRNATIVPNSSLSILTLLFKHMFYSACIPKFFYHNHYSSLENVFVFFVSLVLCVICFCLGLKLFVHSFIRFHPNCCFVMCGNRITSVCLV